jgi:hypothetical protein
MQHGLADDLYQKDVNKAASAKETFKTWKKVLLPQCTRF